jgi:hypothetical protein
MARPFLELIKGGLGVDPSSSSVRFGEQVAPPQPMVHVQPSSEAASRLVQAVRTQPARTPSDDRISLADLTLISVASATQQVAASEVGDRPSTPTATEHAAPGGAAAPGKEQSSDQEIEELARQVFDELQRLNEIARERSGDPWETS